MFIMACGAANKKIFNPDEKRVRFVRAVTSSQSGNSEERGIRMGFFPQEKRGEPKPLTPKNAGS